jgi:site-specific recombinase XerD
MIYLNDACIYALFDYLNERTKLQKNAPNEKALFLSRLNKRISTKMVQAMVYKYLRLAGLESRQYSVHKLRHTAATLMYQSGNVDVRVLKEILGHEQLNTTQIYTHVSNDDMERAMMQNPLAQKRKQK